MNPLTKVESYQWFREHGHEPLRALKRSLECTLSLGKLFPDLFYRPSPEDNIDESFTELETLLDYISGPYFNRQNHLQDNHKPDFKVHSIYRYLRMNAKSFNERTLTEYKRLEQRIFEMQTAKMLPPFDVPYLKQ